jgi:hypothetical protein
MKMVVLDGKAKIPEIREGDTLTVHMTRDDAATEFKSTRTPYRIWVCPVNGGWLLRSEATKTGPMFFASYDKPLEAVSALIALMADDRL